jgi:copper chaperone CopZ
MRKVIQIEGMHCGHCAGLVNIQLYGLKEVMDVKTDIGTKTSIVTLSRNVDNTILSEAIEKAGYQVISID